MTSFALWNLECVERRDEKNENEKSFLDEIKKNFHSF